MKLTAELATAQEHLAAAQAQLANTRAMVEGVVNAKLSERIRELTDAILAIYQAQLDAQARWMCYGNDDTPHAVTAAIRAAAILIGAPVGP